MEAELKCYLIIIMEIFSINNPQQYVMAINELIANRNRNLKSKSFDNTKTKSENEQRQLEEKK